MLNYCINGNKMYIYISTSLETVENLLIGYMHYISCFCLFTNSIS